MASDGRVERNSPSHVIRKKWNGPYSTARCQEQPPELLKRGIEQFNRGEFFEQHETLEDLWRAEPDDVRYLYQGVLQVGVGLHHLRRGNFSGAVSKLSSGVEKLKWFEPVCQGVDVARLVRETSRCLSSLEETGAEGVGAFDWSLAPMVHLVTRGDS